SLRCSGRSTTAFSATADSRSYTRLLLTCLVELGQSGREAYLDAYKLRLGQLDEIPRFVLSPRGGLLARRAAAGRRARSLGGPAQRLTSRGGGDASQKRSRWTDGGGHLPPPNAGHASLAFHHHGGLQ